MTPDERTRMSRVDVLIARRNQKRDHSELTRSQRLHLEREARYKERENRHIFNVCAGFAKNCRVMEFGINAIRPKQSAGGRPRVGNRHAEYISDFDKCGKRTLFCWPARYAMFRMYYVEGMTSRDVMEKLRIGEMLFESWATEIKQAVAPELVRREVYPPDQYKVPIVQPDDESTYTTRFLDAAEFAEAD